MSVQQYEYLWPHHQFWAMGTHINLWLDAESVQAREAFAQIEALFHDVEMMLSRFNPSSELSRLNAQPETWVQVSKTLWNVLTLALHFAEETNGIFDPTVLKALKAAGYRESFGVLQAGGSVKPDEDVGPRDGWRGICLDEQGRSVRLSKAVELDFGGIAKGYTAQWAAHLSSLWGPSLIDAGGDLAASGAPAGFPGWPVTIQAPRIDGVLSNHPLVGLWLANNVLTTSGVDHRRWKGGDKDAHHIIDPRTGQPAITDALTVSVLAPTGAAAEVWAKTALIAGIASLPADLPVLAVKHDGSVHLNEAMSRQIHSFDTEAILLDKTDSVGGQQVEAATSIRTTVF